MKLQGTEGGVFLVRAALLQKTGGLALASCTFGKEVRVRGSCAELGLFFVTLG